ncbi:hypothetical protein [Pseudochelatococcus sp. G4_1912]|uniref:hypothetical protein n=1 Tax=Pseudochelatococcus sp. G4_1912 TaxID=3114288 RepID=UPI0039C67FC7
MLTTASITSLVKSAIASGPRAEAGSVNAISKVAVTSGAQLRDANLERTSKRTLRAIARAFLNIVPFSNIALGYLLFQRGSTAVCIFPETWTTMQSAKLPVSFSNFRWV